MKKLIKASLGLVALGAVVPASALIVIDDFTSGAVNMSISSGSSIMFQNGTMLGGDRYTELLVQSNGFGLEYSVDAAAGTLSVSSQPQVDGIATLGYGYADNGGSAIFDNLNWDFSGESLFEIDVLSNDQDAVITIALRSTTSNPNTIIMSSKNISGGLVNTPTTLTWSFADFAGVDFTDIDQILVEIETGESGDITLSEIRAVPEPATLVALSMGAAALVARRRKKA